MKYIDIIIVGIIFWLCIGYLAVKVYTLYCEGDTYEGIYEGEGTLIEERVYTFSDSGGDAGDVLVVEEGGDLKWSSHYVTRSVIVVGDIIPDTLKLDSFSNLYNTDGVLYGPDGNVYDSLKYAPDYVPDYGNHVSTQNIEYEKDN